MAMNDHGDGFEIMNNPVEFFHGFQLINDNGIHADWHFENGYQAGFQDGLWFGILLIFPLLGSYTLAMQVSLHFRESPLVAQNRLMFLGLVVLSIPLMFLRGYVIAAGAEAWIFNQNQD